MENDYTEPENTQEEDSQKEGSPEEHVEIYSKKAIFWFCVLFNPIFGAALLMQNLRDVGYNREANKVIFFSILYFFIPQLILQQFNLNIIIYFLIILGFNVGAGFILTDYFFTKSFPDDDYYPKSISRVLLRSMVIILIIIILISYLGSITGAKVK